MTGDERRTAGGRTFAPPPIFPPPLRRDKMASLASRFVRRAASLRQVAGLKRRRAEKTKDDARGDADGAEVMPAGELHRIGRDGF